MPNGLCLPTKQPWAVHLTAFDFTHLSPPPTTGTIHCVTGAKPFQTIYYIGFDFTDLPNSYLYIGKSIYWVRLGRFKKKLVLICGEQCVAKARPTQNTDPSCFYKYIYPC